MAFLIVFASTRAFIRGRELVQTAHVPHEVHTTPRELYEQCGMCLYFEDEKRTEVEQILSPSRSELIYLDYSDPS